MRENWGALHGILIRLYIQEYINIVLSESSFCPNMFLVGHKQGILENGIKDNILFYC